MRIALFGGSFDPPHLGHVLCATWAHAMAGADEVWVLPVAEHPYGKQVQPWDTRWQLCEAAFAGLGFVRLRDDELRNPGGRSFDLLAELKRKESDHQWLLIGGSDTEQDLHNWYRGSELRQQVELVAVPRRGYDDGQPAALPAISSTEVRRRLAAGENVDQLLPRRVLALIRKQGWYRTT